MFLFFKDAFSLLAYNDPWSSPIGFQLHAEMREPVCASLNSAILGLLLLQFFHPLHMTNQDTLPR